jgi:large conductance mechanosensitive channel
MAMIKEFRDFVNRGSVIDLAVGIVIGAAFTSVVRSFVDDVLMPPIGLMMGGVDFSELYVNLTEVSYPSLALAMEAGAPLIRYGLFINSIISFGIVAFAIFLVVKSYNRMQPPAPEALVEAEPGRICPYCLEEVRLEARRCRHCTADLSEAVSRN